MNNNYDSNEITVSVICIAYNHEKYIEKTLEGFVAQKTNFKYEVLVHDDASTDHTADIIRSYEKKYPELIKPIYQEENQFSQGIKLLRVYMYPQVKGKYVAFCEGDDYWCDPYKLQKQYDIMEKEQGCSICVHNVQCINEDGSINDSFLPPKDSGLREGILLDDDVAELIWVTAKFPFQLSSYFIRTSMFREYLDNNDLVFTSLFESDQSIMRYCLNIGHYYYLEDIMSCYRLHSINGFMERKHRFSEQQLFDYTLSEIKGDLVFDEYSHQKFHYYVTLMVARKFFYRVKLHPKEVRYYWKLYDVDYKAVKKDLIFEHKVKYFLMRYFPFAFKFFK